MSEKTREMVRVSTSTLILGGSLLVTTVMSFALVKAEADNNRTDIVEHRIDDSKNWEKAFDKIEENEDDIHRIEVQNGRVESALSQILMRLDKGEANDLRIIEKLDGLYNPDYEE